MCGIVGIWNFNQADISNETMDRFTDSLAHRGPDGRGTYHNSQARLQFGHRRLAIIDTSPMGHQPMSYSDGRYWIVLNGEVYNYLELRDELVQKGYEFQSNSDTEVILAAYIEWGENCQLKFNGMWAFAIWDSMERILFISRDRFGIKPLHYIVTERYFAFASETKAFLALPCYDYGFDEQVVAAALDNINGIENTEYCLLQGVKRLIGGHCLTLTSSGIPKVRRWWQTLDHLPSVPRDFKSQVVGFRELLIDACRLRMRSDVPLATSLSGGLDSSAVVCTMHSIGQSEGFTPNWQRSFVACFPGTHLDEEIYAREVIEATHAQGVFTNIDVKQYFESISKIIYDFEELYFVLPLGALLNYQKMRESGVIVSLDGHGADEILGGYHFIVESEKEHALSQMNISRYIDLLRTSQRFIGGSKSESNLFYAEIHALLNTAKSYSLGYLRQSVLGAALRKIYRNLRGRKIAGSITLKPEQDNLLQSKLSSLTHLNRALYSYTHESTLPTILRNFDRCSMAKGIEVRSPFMDWRLVTYAFALPDKSKIGGGYAKRIIREAMVGMLPERIRLRTNKIGFSSPTEDWLRQGLSRFFVDTVNDPEFLKSAIWDGVRLRSLVAEADSRKDYKTMQSAWGPIQAFHLMQEFDKKRAEWTS